MQVKIENSCFFNIANHQDLDALFSLFEQNQHKWIDIDLEEIENTNWFKDLGKRRINLLKTMFVVSTRKSNFNKTINILNDNDEFQFNVFEASFFLKQPLTVIVENYEHEPIFINSIFEKFDPTGELKSAKNMQFLNYENGGGANDNTIKGKLNESYKHPQLKKEKNKYLRCFVIKDSDRKYCIQTENGITEYEEIPKTKTAFLEENNLPFHILHKREKENYMPDKVFNKFLQTPNKKEPKKLFAKVYLSLNHNQKDFFDLEKGFSEKAKNGREIVEREKLEPEIKELYKNLSNKDYFTIGNGISYPKFKSDFSKHFELVDKEDLQKRINHQPLFVSKVNSNDKNECNEFEHIIREIKYLL